MAVLLGAGLWRLWSGPGGLRELAELRERVALEARRIRLLEARNRVLGEEVRGLRAGTDAIESRARYDLGMIRRGEVFYRVPEG